MKYGITILATIFLSGIFCIDANGQILNRLKKKAQKAAEDKVEEKISEQVERAAQQAVEQSWNAVFGEMISDSSSGTRLPFSMSSNVKTEDQYHFSTISTMEVRSINKDGSEEPPVIIDMHFNENEQYTGTKFNSEEMKQKGGDLFIIYDFKNAAMLMLMENEGEKFSFAYDWEQSLDTADEDSLFDENTDWEDIEEWQNYKKIGNKNILGYNCSGYRSESENEIIEIWVTRDAAFGMNNMFSANANAKQLKGKIPDDYPYGMIMEMTAENQQNGEQTIMKVINIEENAVIRYTMADYPTMSFANASQKK